MQFNLKESCTKLTAPGQISCLKHTHSLSPLTTNNTHLIDNLMNILSIHHLLHTGFCIKFTDVLATSLTADRFPPTIELLGVGPSSTVRLDVGDDYELCPTDETQRARKRCDRCVVDRWYVCNCLLEIIIKESLLEGFSSKRTSLNQPCASFLTVEYSQIKKHATDAPCRGAKATDTVSNGEVARDFDLSDELTIQCMFNPAVRAPVSYTAVHLCVF